MSEYRSTISFNESTLEILDKAGNIWPEFAGNRSALFRKIAADWDRIRTEAGGRTTRLEQRMDAQERVLQRICDRLGIDTEAIDAER